MMHRGVYEETLTARLSAKLNGFYISFFVVVVVMVTGRLSLKVKYCATFYMKEIRTL